MRKGILLAIIFLFSFFSIEFSTIFGPSSIMVKGKDPFGNEVGGMEVNLELNMWRNRVHNTTLISNDIYNGHYTIDKIDVPFLRRVSLKIADNQENQDENGYVYSNDGKTRYLFAKWPGREMYQKEYTEVFDIFDVFWNTFQVFWSLLPPFPWFNPMYSYTLLDQHLYSGTGWSYKKDAGSLFEESTFNVNVPTGCERVRIITQGRQSTFGNLDLYSKDPEDRETVDKYRKNWLLFWRWHNYGTNKGIEYSPFLLILDFPEAGNYRIRTRGYDGKKEKDIIFGDVDLTAKVYYKDYANFDYIFFSYIQNKISTTVIDKNSNVLNEELEIIIEKDRYNTADNRTGTFGYCYSDIENGWFNNCVDLTFKAPKIIFESGEIYYFDKFEYYQNEDNDKRNYSDDNYEYLELKNIRKPKDILVIYTKMDSNKRFVEINTYDVFDGSKLDGYSIECHSNHTNPWNKDEEIMLTELISSGNKEQVSSAINLMFYINTDNPGKTNTITQEFETVSEIPGKDLRIIFDDGRWSGNNDCGFKFPLNSDSSDIALDINVKRMFKLYSYTMPENLTDVINKNESWQENGSNYNISAPKIVNKDGNDYYFNGFEINGIYVSYTNCIEVNDNMEYTIQSINEPKKIIAYYLTSRSIAIYATNYKSSGEYIDGFEMSVKEDGVSVPIKIISSGNEVDVSPTVNLEISFDKIQLFDNFNLVTEYDYRQEYKGIFNGTNFEDENINTIDFSASQNDINIYFGLKEMYKIETTASNGINNLSIKREGNSENFTWNDGDIFSWHEKNSSCSFSAPATVSDDNKTYYFKEFEIYTPQSDFPQIHPENIYTINNISTPVLIKAIYAEPIKIYLTAVDSFGEEFDDYELKAVYSFLNSDYSSNLISGSFIEVPSNIELNLVIPEGIEINSEPSIPSQEFYHFPDNGVSGSNLRVKLKKIDGITPLNNEFLINVENDAVYVNIDIEKFFKTVVSITPSIISDNAQININGVLVGFTDKTAWIKKGENYSTSTPRFVMGIDNKKYEFLKFRINEVSDISKDSIPEFSGFYTHNKSNIDSPTLINICYEESLNSHKFTNPKKKFIFTP